MNSQARNKQYWEEMGALDPFWAILSDPSKKFNRWDPEEFFQTGRDEITALMGRLSAYGLHVPRRSALDFGCGVGRLTQALADHFDRVTGIDISAAMTTRARELNKKGERCDFVTSDSLTLPFPSASFDLIYTRIVLQHIPRPMILEYVAEFIRVLRPQGAIVMQVPSRIPVINRVQPRTLGYALLRKMGFPERFVFEKLGLHPIRMNFVPEQEMIAHIERHGGKVISVRADGSTQSKRNESRVYTVTKA
jgi:ubiquinone/menaquinone biosynthesis C-methylase UbiE